VRRSIAHLGTVTATGIAAAVIGLGTGGTALAASPPGSGQPGQTCGSATAPDTPAGGNSASSPGSPFNGGMADSHYAGTQPQNSNNPKSVSQYDVACFQVSQH
jgi:hypothetical protein